jgi:hypothetical protein
MTCSIVCSHFSHVMRLSSVTRSCHDEMGNMMQDGAVPYFCSDVCLEEPRDTTKYFQTLYMWDLHSGWNTMLQAGRSQFRDSIR